MTRARAARLVAALLLGGCGRARAQNLTEFEIAKPNVQTSSGIVAGPDGNLWFPEITLGTAAQTSRGPLVMPEEKAIARMSPDGALAEFPITPAGFTAPFPQSIAAGPDGNLWFPEGNVYGELIGRISTAGVVTEFPIPTLVGTRIAAGPDGNLWIAGAGAIARVTTQGESTLFPFPDFNHLPGGITAGSDGNLWFTDSGTNQIGRITPAGVLAEFPIPSPRSGAGGIASGPDGNLWFTESLANKIGRITPSGSITEFPIPSPNTGPLGIVAGPDGNLWFTETNSSAIGRVTTAGVVSSFFIPASGRPADIATGPDGNLWITEFDASKIGRVAISGPACPSDPHVLCLGDGRFSATASYAPRGGGAAAPATAVTLTRDTGYFWFFDAANIELVTKVLDGCGADSRYWVFVAGLTDVGVDLTVTDLRTGASKTYSNAPGDPFRPVQDTAAFPCP